MPVTRDLPTNVLRSFVSIVDEGGFTQAAACLGLTQPTISQQLKKLEDQVGQPLLERGRGGVRLTGEGQTLLDYARRILTLNDEAVSSLSRTPISGKLRLGLPHEFTYSVLPKLVGGFSQIHPDVVVEVECELSKKLLAKLDRYDVVMALHRPDEIRHGIPIRREKLSWASSLDYAFDPEVALKVVAAPPPCIYRDLLQQALGKYAAGWTLLLSSTSYSAMCAAVSTGMGVTVLAESVVPANLRRLVDDRLPALKDLELRLHYDPTNTTDATQTFVDFIQNELLERNDLAGH